MSALEELDGLIGQVSLGSMEAMHRLYDRLAPKLYGICLHGTGSAPGSGAGPADAAMHDALMALRHGARNPAPHGTSRLTWVLGLARRAAIAARPAEAPLMGAGPLWQPPANGEAALARALKSLPVRQAGMIRSAYLLGMHTGEEDRAALERALSALRAAIDPGRSAGDPVAWVQAGMYVLDALPGPEATEFAARLAKDTLANSRCRGWEEDLAALIDPIPEVLPPARIRARLEDSLAVRRRKPLLQRLMDGALTARY